MGAGADPQTIAELKAQNDRLMANQVIIRNAQKAQSARMDKMERQRDQDQATKTVLDDCHTWLFAHFAKGGYLNCRKRSRYFSLLLP
jgi:hypothetical protein